jgi:hypothetical protein
MTRFAWLVVGVEWRGGKGRATTCDNNNECVKSRILFVARVQQMKMHPATVLLENAAA